MRSSLVRELVGRRSPAVAPEAEEAAHSEEEAAVEALVVAEVLSEAAAVVDRSAEEAEEVDRLAVAVAVVVVVRLEVASSRECVYLFYALCWFDQSFRRFTQTGHRCAEGSSTSGE